MRPCRRWSHLLRRGLSQRLHPEPVRFRSEPVHFGSELVRFGSVPSALRAETSFSSVRWPGHSRLLHFHPAAISVAISSFEAVASFAQAAFASSVAGPRQGAAWRARPLFIPASRAISDLALRSTSCSSRKRQFSCWPVRLRPGVFGTSAARWGHFPFNSYSA